MGQPWSIDFGNMFEFFVRKDQRYQLQHTKELYPGVQSLRQWIERNARSLYEAFTKL